MKKILWISLFSSTLAAAELMPIVQKMGDLNGMALACRYFDHSKKIKLVLIENLPKKRELGQLFEDHTQQGYMRIIQKEQACPDPIELTQQIEQATAQLKSSDELD